MGELFRNDYYVVDWRQGEPFVRLTRTAKAFDSIDDTTRTNDQTIAALEKMVARGVLMDLRHGPPGRNDPAFEEANVHWRRELGRIFDKRAILVKSAAGRLQIRRLTQGADNILVTLDEAEAVQFLR